VSLAGCHGDNKILLFFDALIVERLVARTMLTHQRAPVAVENHPRATFGAGKAVGLDGFCLGRLFGQGVGVDNLIRFDFAIQDGHCAPHLGVVGVDCQGFFEMPALFDRVARHQSQVEIGLEAGLVVVGHHQGAFKIPARRVIFPGFVMDDAHAHQVIVVLAHNLSSNNRIGHAGDLRHLDRHHARAQYQRRAQCRRPPLRRFRRRVGRRAGRGCNR
jgi:hypothetical protein